MQALDVAAGLGGHADVVDALLGVGAVVNTARTNGMTPLFMAAQFGKLHTTHDSVSSVSFATASTVLFARVSTVLFARVHTVSFAHFHLLGSALPTCTKPSISRAPHTHARARARPPQTHTTTKPPPPNRQPPNVF